ncbi:hypothetical protein E2L07_16520 [Halalkalibacterium halodurans]|nr:hypothetical protein E2L07_16520 [Halalkalibacterium halodurans]
MTTWRTLSSGKLQLPREPHSRRSFAVAFPAGVAACRSKEPKNTNQHKNRENHIKRFSRFYFLRCFWDSPRLYVHIVSL